MGCFDIATWAATHFDFALIYRLIGIAGASKRLFICWPERRRASTSADVEFGGIYAPNDATTS